jgi:hypothetical protein
MCLRAQVPRQPPPGKMVRRGGDGRSRLGAMATDPEVRPEGSVAHASTGGASPPEDRAHQRPRGARPGRVVSAGVRPGARTAKGTRARLSDSAYRRNAFPAAASHGQRAVSQPGGWSAAGSTPTLRSCATRSKASHRPHPRRTTRRVTAALDIAFSGSALPDERASDVGQWKWLHRTTTGRPLARDQLQRRACMGPQAAARDRYRADLAASPCHESPAYAAAAPARSATASAALRPRPDFTCT